MRRTIFLARPGTRLTMQRANQVAEFGSNWNGSVVRTPLRTRVAVWPSAVRCSPKPILMSSAPESRVKFISSAVSHGMRALPMRTSTSVSVVKHTMSTSPWSRPRCARSPIALRISLRLGRGLIRNGSRPGPESGSVQPVSRTISMYHDSCSGPSHQSHSPCCGRPPSRVISPAASPSRRAVLSSSSSAESTMRAVVLYERHACANTSSSSRSSSTSSTARAGSGAAAGASVERAALALAMTALSCSRVSVTVPAAGAASPSPELWYMRTMRT